MVESNQALELYGEQGFAVWMTRELLVVLACHHCQPSDREKLCADEEQSE
jgi:hypothetical protein